MAQGELAVVSDTVERIAGHPPTTLRELVQRDPGTVGHLGHLT